MTFDNLLLSHETVSRLSKKVNFEVNNEDTLCFAIKQLLDMHDNQSQNIEYLLGLTRKNGIKTVFD